MFTSDLTTFLHMLKETQANGVISTEGVGTDAGRAWQAQLTLSQGRVTFCQIQSRADGQTLLKDRPALSWLANQGTLLWEQQPIRQQELLPSPSHDAQANQLQPEAVPQRLAPLEAEGMTSWSRKQRQVFGLVDGQRSIERIAILLRQPLDIAEEIVQELQSLGVIAVQAISPEVRAEQRV